MESMGKLLIVLLLAGVVQAGGIKWEKNLAAAKKRAAAENKLLYIDIYADW